MPRPRTRQYVTFEGRDYALDKDGYWKTNVRPGSGAKQQLLHRDIWESANGRPVPQGWHVHHLDHDKSNNDPGNLHALSAGEHSALHGPDRGWAAWDADTRSEQRRLDWERREPTARTCLNCGGEYYSTGQRAKYCNADCREAYNHDKRREQQRALYDPAKRRAKHDRAQRRARERATGAGV